MSKYRDFTISQLSGDYKDKTVRISGWVHRIRDHKERFFINVRDRDCFVQAFCEKTRNNEGLIKTIKNMKLEYVVSVKGVVRLRPADQLNPDQAKGDIEIEISSLQILNSCENLPFEVNNDEPVAENLSLKYRYLDLRRQHILKNLKLRHEVVLYVRNFLSQRGFMEIETPLLTRSSPEGARDFIVPSRRFRGSFYALPQSPQQYKEILMIGGIDRYFQIARCLRDEDARADRQIEHTQIDMEMSFVEVEDILSLLEELFMSITENCTEKTVQDRPFRRIPYEEAMERYGSDKPDIRFGMELRDMTKAFQRLEVPFLKDRFADDDFCIKGIIVPDMGQASRKDLDSYKSFLGNYRAEGMLFIADRGGDLKTSIDKFCSQEQLKNILLNTGLKENELFLLSFGNRKHVNAGLGHLRKKFGDELGLYNPAILGFAFIVDFPLFELDDEGAVQPVHHMFVLPREEDMALLDSDPLKVRGTQYDIVCNGYELCSGSLRIHEEKLQRKIMSLIGLTREDQDSKFSSLLTALRYGAPPHGGAAPGLDRLIMVLAGTEKMRDVLAFPKTTEGKDLLMDAPSPVDKKQLEELRIVLKDDEKK